MSEYVGKPFDIDHLVAVLLRQCGAAPRPAPARRTALAPALLDQARAAGIDIEEALGRLSGKTELFDRMVGALAQTAEDLPAELEGLAGARALHGFRGLAATLGATALAGLAALGERALQAGETVPEGWRAQFNGALRRDLAALADLAGQLPAAEEAVAGDLALQPALRGLIELLDGADLAALEAFSRLRTGLFGVHPVVTAALDVDLAALDFSTAAGRCRRLLELA